MIYSDEWPFVVPANVEVVGEPLKEYSVGVDDSLSLEREPRLLGVKVSGKWGWIDKAGYFVIPPEYDEAVDFTHNGILVLKKDGKYGGICLRDFSVAFSFKYLHLSHKYKQTFVAQTTENFWGETSEDCWALVQPIDRIISGAFLFISPYHVGNITVATKKSFVGAPFNLKIDLDTGQDLGGL